MKEWTVVFVKDEQSAIAVADVVSSIDKGEGCDSGLLCKTDDARVIAVDSSVASVYSVISAASNCFWMMKTLFFLLFFIVCLLN